jgi:hypothetical protein
MIEIKPGEYGGSYMHYGVREHGMAAAMNGIALHGGLIPYGGTFLSFSAYCRTTRSVSARTARPISRSSNSRRCGPSLTSRSIARGIRSRPPNAGRPS